MINNTLLIDNPNIQLIFDPADGAGWCYRAGSSGQTIHITFPVFEIDGEPCPVQLEKLDATAPARRLRNGCQEYRFTGTLCTHPDITLEFIARVAEDNPVLRFRYVLTSTGSHLLTKSAGRDVLTYASVSIPPMATLTEVQFSVFNEMVHSYCLQENRLDERAFDDSLSYMGPLLVWQTDGQAALLAYEHG